MRRSTTRWRAIVEGFESSGLTVAEYCAGRHVSPGSFFRWRRLLRDGDGGEPSRKPTDHRIRSAFVEAFAPRASGAASPVIEVRRWRVVVPDGFDAVTLARLISTLERLDVTDGAIGSERLA